MKVVVLMNAAAGASASPSPDEVKAALEAAGVTADVRPTPGDRLPDAARVAIEAGAEVVVAAGGDGTVSAVASALVGTQTPLGVLPLGTLNHFSKDLGIPTNLQEAARAIAAATVRSVDIAEVNGNYFLNNSSIGLYPQIVSRRDQQRARLGRGKWLAMVFAFLSVFRRYPVVKVVIDTGEQALPRTTPFVFFGNNRYELSGLSLGARQALDRGELSVYLANRTGRLGLLRLAVRALLGRLNEAEDFDSMCLTECRVETRKKTLKVSLDGEVRRLLPPLVYRVVPGGLRVIGPAPLRSGNAAEAQPAFAAK